MSKRTLLVTGASGQLGAAVLSHLANSGDTVIGGTRHPEKLPGSRLVDFDKPETLDAAFKGVDRLLLISTDTFGETRQRQQKAAIDAAKKAGVKHIVYTSLPNAESSKVTLIAPDHLSTEKAIEASGIEHTFLRNNMYIDLFLGGFAHAISSGKLYSAAGTGKIGFVTRDDCAAIAAAALASTESGSRTFDVNGPQSLGYADLAQLLSEISGKKVEYVAVSDEAQKNGLVGAGLPPFVADLFVQFDNAAAAGQLETNSDAVTKLTGKAPTSVKQYLTANKAKLVH